MHGPHHGQSDARRTTAVGGGMHASSYHLRRVLAVAIVVTSIAPVIFHRHPVFHSTTDTSRHPFLRRNPTSLGDRIRRSVGEKMSSSSVDRRGNAGVALPPNIGEAGRSLLLRALDERPIWDDDVHPEIEEKRCSKYFAWENGTAHYLSYDGSRRVRRRLFLGSLIADDSWHALGALAIESYGLYEAVVFVESNRTQTGIPRELRFANGTTERKILVESGLFGPNTPVFVENFVNEKNVGYGIMREQMQRGLILDTWKKVGMTKDDIGVLTDADECLTRDFLRAMQICELPHLNPETQNCHTAKLISASMVFEGSPECMTVTRKWMHPDLILGKCIEGIGDDAYRLDATQRQRNNKLAWRKKEYTHKYGDYIGWPKEKKTFPLWNAADFRRDQGGHIIMFENVDYLPFGMGHTGYHFHNYFETTQQLRNKYMTYGHPVKEAENMSISEMHPDLDVMVDCVLGRSATNNKHNVSSVAGFGGRIPIAYELDGYSIARHVELEKILNDDERGHGKTWHDNPKSKDWFQNIPP